MSVVPALAKRCRAASRWLLALSLSVVLAPALTFAGQDDWQGVERIIAIGDIHGDYDNYISVLKEAGVVNRRGRWVAGKTHVVQVGDIPDRGPDTLKIIRHLQKLEKQAKKAGGYLHLLIGNHEYMNITGDLRYVHPGEYAAFETRNSKQVRDNYYNYVVQTLERQRQDLLASGHSTNDLPIVDETFEQNWYVEHPLGFVEHRLAWQQGGDIFEWVASHNTIIRINGTLFLHGGLSSTLLPMTLSEINDRIRAELNREPVKGEPLGTADFGPLWYRGLARGNETAEGEALQAILSHFDAQTIVLGHTPDLKVITPRFGGQVIVVDTGISSAYGGQRASLLIDANGATALHGTMQQRLPTSEDEMLPYFEALAEKMPENARLSGHIETLKSMQSTANGSAPDSASTTAN